MGMKLSAEDAAKMIEELDEDKDGFLSWEEFRKAMVEWLIDEVFAYVVSYYQRWLSEGLFL